MRNGQRPRRLRRVRFGGVHLLLSVAASLCFWLYLAVGIRARPSAPSSLVRVAAPPLFRGATKFFVFAQAAATTSGVVVSEELYQHDLVLVNPIQSTSIFAVIIFMSAAMEFMWTRIDTTRSRTLRCLVSATKEELTAFALSHMLLMWAAFSLPVKEQWKHELMFVAMMLTGMAVAFVIVAVVGTVTRRRAAAAWRAFEWARLDNDPAHTSVEALFKRARAVFLKHCRRSHDAMFRSDRSPNGVTRVLFSAFHVHAEGQLRPHFYDFTVATFAGLSLAIVIDGLRSVIVASATGSPPRSQEYVLAHALSFICVSGLMWMVGYVLLFIALWVRLSRAVDQDAAEDAALSRGLGLDDDDDDDDARLAALLEPRSGHSPDVRNVSADGHTQRAFYPTVGGRALFGSPETTLALFKVFTLQLLWYGAYFALVFVQMAWGALGPAAIALYVFALVPVVVHLALHARIIDFILIATSVGAAFDPGLVEDMVAGTFDVFDDDVSLEELAAEAFDSNMAAGNASQARPPSAVDGNRFDAAADNREPSAEPGEYEGPVEMTMHGPSSPGTALGPGRVMGVAPIMNRPYEVKPERPVFDVW